MDTKTKNQKNQSNSLSNNQKLEIMSNKKTEVAEVQGTGATQPANVVINENSAVSADVMGLPTEPVKAEKELQAEAKAKENLDALYKSVYGDNKEKIASYKRFRDRNFGYQPGDQFTVVNSAPQAHSFTGSDGAEHKYIAFECKDCHGQTKWISADQLRGVTSLVGMKFSGEGIKEFSFEGQTELSADGVTPKLIKFSEPVYASVIPGFDPKMVTILPWLTVDTYLMECQNGFLKDKVITCLGKGLATAICKNQKGYQNFNGSVVLPGYRNDRNYTLWHIGKPGEFEQLTKGLSSAEDPSTKGSSTPGEIPF